MLELKTEGKIININQNFAQKLRYNRKNMFDKKKTCFHNIYLIACL